MIPFDELLSRLDYDRSPYYRTTEHMFEPETVHIFRASRSAGVRGIYVFQTSPVAGPVFLPTRPAVCVAEATNEEEARSIHRKVWNLSSAPFLIIRLPHQIRVYTGFSYSATSEMDGLLGLSDDLDRLHTLTDLLQDLSASSIDSGAIWQSPYARHLHPEQRVDTSLLKHLNVLGKELQKHGVREDVAHALIGKYVYFSYLRDRQFLSDEWLHEYTIAPNHIFGTHATKEAVQRLTDILEHRFNGKIFPLDFDQENLDDMHISWVASVFSGAEIHASACDIPATILQLHLPFKAYDFQYIPVETFSAIYEQFIYDRKKKGAVYTPEMLADYLLSEIESVNPLQRGMKILDPSCGSGIFLVLAYRRLIEKEMRRLERNLEPAELRDLLLESIYGIERERDACYVTEFSLILTLMNYIHTDDLSTLSFQFPSLHNQHIFECDFFDTQALFWHEPKIFDWIVGNPPWIRIHLDPCTPGEEHVCAWMNNPKNKAERPISQHRVAEACSWHVTDVLAPTGVVGLVLPATSLSSQTSETYRQYFFARHDVLRMTNFTNLREVLFGGRSEMPAFTIVYRLGTGDQEKPYIVHYAPFTINQITNNHMARAAFKPWIITIHESEIQTISPHEAEQGENRTWKLALWGTYRDRRTLERISQQFPTTLQDMCTKRGWSMYRNVELRDGSTGVNNDIKYIPELRDKKMFYTERMQESLFRFSVQPDILERIPDEMCYIRKRGGKAGMAVTYAPHIILSPGWMNYIIYSDDDFVIPPLHIGIASPVNDSPYLRALSVYLCSSLVAYHLFFNSAEWGIFRRRNHVSMSEVARIPVPEFTEEQVQKLAMLHENIIATEYQHITKVAPEEKHERDTFLVHLRSTIQERIDQSIANIFGIPQSIHCLVNEFVQIRLLLDKRATMPQAVREPTPQELLAYAVTLRDDLDGFLMGAAHHRIIITYASHLIECQIEMHRDSTAPFPVNEEYIIRSHEDTIEQRMRKLDNTLREQVSQWVYVKRGLRLFDGPRVFLYKSPRLIDWTRTQAMNDASEIIGQSIAAARGHHGIN